MPGWTKPTAKILKDAEELAGLDAKLPDILLGKILPANMAEHLRLAQFCQDPCKGLYAASARLYSDAFKVQQKLVADPRTTHQYNAACAAALAGCSQGKDAAKLDEKERTF
jgi:eukaryotic-like serine/threonine-protein kinase